MPGYSIGDRAFVKHDTDKLPAGTQVEVVALSRSKIQVLHGKEPHVVDADNLEAIEDKGSKSRLIQDWIVPVTIAGLTVLSIVTSMVLSLGFGVSQGLSAAGSIMFLLICYFGIIIVVFSQRLDANADKRGAITKMVQITYFFAFFFLFIVLLPLLFMLPGLFGSEVDVTGEASAKINVRNAPFFVSKACIPVDREDDISELSCSSDTNAAGQWVFNFGGIPVGLWQPGSVAEDAQVPAPTQDQAQDTTVSNDYDQSGTIVKLSGGLIIPVYFIFIAMAGALVGMLQKIPEIQRKSFNGLAAIEKNVVAAQDAYSIGETRERLIFQIAQIVTTPFVAMLAYTLIKPESSMATTVIAFASGFTTESFLIVVRNVGDRISGSKSGADNS